jgi:ATP-dependent DNA ligase
VFRPLMLAHPLEDADLPGLDLAAHQVEWKWDGIRVQVAAAGGEARLFSRAGDEVGAAFPEVAEAARGLDAVLDGELLVGRPGEGGAAVDVASFSELQQRLNRKAVTAAMLRERPAFVRLYDLLLEGARTSGPCRWRSGGGGWRRSWPGRRRRGWTSRRWCRRRARRASSTRCGAGRGARRSRG